MKNVHVHERSGLELGPLEKCLTDGRNFLRAYFDAEGLVTSFTSYISNGSPYRILSEIAETFEVEVVSERDPRFWGFETQKEWDAWLDAEREKQEEEFLGDVMKFARGEHNNIKPGTIGMIQAQAAKRLVADFPEFFWLWTGGPG